LYLQPFLKSFAHALDAIPLAVAENSGLLPFDTLTMLKSRHIKVLFTCILSLLPVCKLGDSCMCLIDATRTVVVDFCIFFQCGIET
jgi:chaperonin GroEL (HSP60 family)